MKNHNINTRPAYNIRLQKTMDNLGLCFIVLGLIGSALPEQFELAANILRFGGYGLGAIFFLIAARFSPNLDTYRCSVCGHAHIPDCRLIFRTKKRLHCPNCNEKTVHNMVTPYENRI